jgi:hypothetical protein
VIISQYVYFLLHGTRSTAPFDCWLTSKAGNVILCESRLKRGVELLVLGEIWK